jgi:hypothetical protein
MLRHPGSSWTVAVAALVLACAVAPTLAQTPTRDQPFPQIREGRRWGPFMAEPSFSIDNIGYDDNIFLVSPEEEQLTGREQVGDLVVQGGPEVLLQTRLGPNIALTLRDKLTGELFLENSDLNHADNTFEGQLDVLLGPFLLTSRGRWSTLRQRPNSSIDERARQDRVSLEQTLRLFVGPQTDVAGSVGVNRRRFEDPDFDQLYGTTVIDENGELGFELVDIGTAFDRDETWTEVEVGWRPRGRVRYYAIYEVTDYDFVAESSPRDSRTRRAGLGIEFRPNAFISGRLLYGTATLESTDDRLEVQPEQYDGAFSETQIVYRATALSLFRLRYERDANFTTYERNFYFEEEFAGLDAQWFPGVRWGLLAGVSQRNLDFPEKTVAGGTEERADEIFNRYLGLAVSLSPDFRIDIRYGKRSRESNLLFANDEQNYISTSTSLQF